MHDQVTGINQQLVFSRPWDAAHSIVCSLSEGLATATGGNAWSPVVECSRLWSICRQLQPLMLLRS